MEGGFKRPMPMSRFAQMATALVALLPVASYIEAPKFGTKIRRSAGRETHPDFDYSRKEIKRRRKQNVRRMQQERC